MSLPCSSYIRGSRDSALLSSELGLVRPRFVVRLDLELTFSARDTRLGSIWPGARLGMQYARGLTQLETRLIVARGSARLGSACYSGLGSPRLCLGVGLRLSLELGSGLNLGLTSGLSWGLAQGSGLGIRLGLAQDSATAWIGTRLGSSWLGKYINMQRYLTVLGAPAAARPAAW